MTGNTPNRLDTTNNTTDSHKEQEPKVTDKFIPLQIENNNEIEDSNKNPTTIIKKKRKYAGLIITVVAAMQFSLSALLIKILNYHPFNLGAWRFLIMAVIPVPFLWHAAFWKKQKVFAPLYSMNSTLIYLILQAILGSNSLVFLFYGLRYLNVADALVITTSAPVFVTLLAFIFLGEKAGVFPFFMAILTICGVGVISRPPMLTGAAAVDSNLMIGVGLCLSSMLCLTSTYIIIRYLRTVNHALLNLCFSLWGWVECVILGYYFDVLCLPQNITEIGIIFASAVLAFFAQTCLTLALKFEEAGPVSLIRTTEILFAFGWQLIFLKIVPDIFSVFGASLVICALILTVSRKMLTELPDDHKYKKTCRCLLS